MGIFKQVLSIASLLVIFSASAFGCVTSDDPINCDKPGDATATFRTEAFTTVGAYKEFSFGPAVNPGENFSITSASLSVKTKANGHWGDRIEVFNGSDWIILGYLDQVEENTETFALDSSYFDEILNGILFRAWFSWDKEYISLAELTVNGVCPTPSQVPVPGAVYLFGSAMVGLIGFGKRKKAALKQA